MSSGVGLDPQCVEKFQELKLGKKIKYIIYKLDDPKKPSKIVVEKASESSDYDAFLEEFDDANCCYAVYDFEFDQGEGKRNKICFFIWAPDTSSIKQKMVYASSKDVLKRALVGLSADIQGTDHSEIAHSVVLDRVTRK